MAMKDIKQRHINFMENSLEGGDPVMWKKKEYKFKQYFSGKGTETLAYIEDFRGKFKTAPAKELDLILELRFNCGDEE